MSGFLIPPMGYSAEFSDCLRYRYFLRRIWNDQGPICAWVMLNPSTADAQTDDHTIRKCMQFAGRWGFGGIVVANLFALRSTNPRELDTHPEPIGPDNDTWIAEAAKCQQVVLAWGCDPMAMGRDNAVLDYLEARGCTPLCLTRTKDGYPGHPLRLPYSLVPVPYTRRAAR